MCDWLITFIDGEAQGGACYCAIASLSLMNRLDALDSDMRKDLIRWCEARWATRKQQFDSKSSVRSWIKLSWILNCKIVYLLMCFTHQTSVRVPRAHKQGTWQLLRILGGCNPFHSALLWHYRFRVYTDFPTARVPKKRVYWRVQQVAGLLSGPFTHVLFIVLVVHGWIAKFKTNWPTAWCLSWQV